MNVKILTMLLVMGTLLTSTVLAGFFTPAKPTIVELKMKIDKFFIPYVSSGQLLAVTGTGDISYVGDTFQHIFTLTNTNGELPEMDEGDGVITRIYKTHRMYDQAGNMVQEGDFEEIIETMNPSDSTTYTIQLPISEGTPSGRYASTSILFSIQQSWDRDTNTWSLLDAVILDKQGVTFEVQTPTPAPTPTPASLWGKILNLFQPLINWIISLFT